MLYLYLLILQFLIIFLLSRRVTREIYRFFYQLTNSRGKAAYLFSIFFLIGTFIHEMSHFLMSLILFVKVGQMELIPEIKEDRLKMGSIPVAQTDPVRRLLIGVAPFIFGTTFIISLLYFTVYKFNITNPLIYILIGYAVFSVANTMFSSKKDLEGTLIFIGLISFITITLYVLGFRIPISRLIQTEGGRVENFLKISNIFLFVPIILNLLLILLLKRKK